MTSERAIPGSGGDPQELTKKALAQWNEWGDGERKTADGNSNATALATIYNSPQFTRPSQVATVLSSGPMTGYQGLD